MPGTRSKKTADLKEISDSSDDEEGDVADAAGTTAEEEKEEEEEEGEEFTVEAILKKRTISGVTKYLIKWEGFDEPYNTWEPEENLDCGEILEEFERAWKENRAKAKTGKARPGGVSSSSSPNPTPSTRSAAATTVALTAQDDQPTDGGVGGDDLDHFDEQGKKSTPLQIKTNYRRMDLRPQVHVEGQLKLYGLDRGLEPRYIVGTIANSKGKKFFLVVWNDSEEGDMVPVEEFSAKYSEFARSYFESHRVWLPSIDDYKEQDEEVTFGSDPSEPEPEPVPS